MEQFLGAGALHASVQVTGSGDNEIVAAVAGKKIRLLSYVLMASAAVNAKWQSNATDITGLKYFVAAGGGIVAPHNPAGWCETVAGEKLDLNLSGAVPIGGEITYQLID
jgi:hypothetical protein